MNPMPMVKSCCHYLDNIVLRPSVTLSLSSYNKNTGTFSDQKSISLSAGITLLRSVLMIMGLFATLYGLLSLFRAKERRKIRKAIKKRHKRR